ncbi:MAG: hemerythrin domain-containing protein [Myxococcota bacterium]|jgi:hemerythrin-like domain-containing protein
MSFTQAFTDHHRHCDETFARAEDAAQQGDWTRARADFDAFAKAMAAHFGSEEETLFPAFEERTGMRQGPTQVMRMEHQQMRQLLGEMTAALDAKDADGFAGAAETLLVLMQQHNMKEEHMLYPMCDRALGDDGALLEKTRAELARA